MHTCAVSINFLPVTVPSRLSFQIYVLLRSGKFKNKFVPVQVVKAYGE